MEQLVRTSDKRGEAYLYTVAFDEGRIGYRVACTLLPEDVSRDKAREWSERMAEGQAKSKHFKSKKPIQLGDVAGMEVETGFITLGRKKIEVTERFLRVGKYDYHVSVNTTVGTTDRKDIAKFLDSFQLLDPARKKQKEGDDAKGVFLHDEFLGVRDAALDRHWMNTGPGWIEYGKGIWLIGKKRAKIISQQPQDVIAADAANPDGTLFCDLITPAKEGMDAGLVVRMVDNENYWMIAIRDNRVEAYKKSAGAYTSLGVPPFAFRLNTTYHLKVTVKGNNLTAFVDGKQVIQVTMDAFLKATKYGLRDNSAPGCQPGWANFWVTSGAEPPKESQLIPEVQKLNGYVETDKKDPARPVLKIYFRSPGPNDSDPALPGG